MRATRRALGRAPTNNETEPSGASLLLGSGVTMNMVLRIVLAPLPRLCKSQAIPRSGRRNGSYPPETAF